jgi:hypothetical protein
MWEARAHAAGGAAAVLARLPQLSCRTREPRASDARHRQGLCTGVLPVLLQPMCHCGDKHDEPQQLLLDEAAEDDEMPGSPPRGPSVA